MLALWALSWSLVNRVIAHRFHYAGHLAIGGFGVIAASLMEALGNYLGFAFSAEERVATFASISNAVLISVLIFGHLRLISRGSTLGLLLPAGLIGIAFLALAILPNARDGQFRSEPEMSASLKPPVAALRGGRNSQTYYDDATSALDAARFAQRVREVDARVLLFASQWASSERLIELGGNAVEGMVLHSYFDPDSKAAGLLRLRQAYAQRFLREPGFAGVAAYDAMQAVLEGLARRQGRQSLREALLTGGPFTGAEDGMTFDRNGDSRRLPHIAVVRDGRFVTVR